MMTQGAGGWYYGIGTEKHGPISFAELQQLVRSGQLGPQVLVWADGMPSWIPAGRVPALFPSSGDDAALGLIVPTGNISGLAIAAGYCGLLGLILPLAPVGIILGALALRDLKLHPEKKGMGRAITGIVAGSIWTLLFAWMLLLNLKR